MSAFLVIAEAPVAAILFFVAAKRQHAFHPSERLGLGE
jgi:hypothetical protein